MFLVRKLIPILVALSSICGLILVGGYAYSGSIFPVTGEGANKDAVTWVLWALLIGIPILTLCLITVAWRKKLP